MVETGLTECVAGGVEDALLAVIKIPMTFSPLEAPQGLGTEHSLTSHSLPSQTVRPSIPVRKPF